MEIRRVGVAVLMSLSLNAIAVEPVATVVAIRYAIQENDVDELEKTICTPVERSLQQLPRIVTLNSATTHGRVDIEAGFEGGATAQDVVAVTAQIEKLKLDDNKAVLVRSIELRSPRLQPEKR